MRFLDSGSEKQGLTGRGKAIAAIGTGRPPMAMAMAKGACHVCSLYVPIKAAGTDEEAERPVMLRVFGRLPVTDVRRAPRAGVRKASGEETAGGVCAGGGVGLWGFSVDVGPDPPVWNRDDG